MHIMSYECHKNIQKNFSSLTRKMKTILNLFYSPFHDVPKNSSLQNTV